MKKSVWIEVFEWCVLALVVLFTLGVYLTGVEVESSGLEDPARAVWFPE